jgi:hypothetical protein
VPLSLSLVTLMTLTSQMGKLPPTANSEIQFSTFSSLEEIQLRM